ncbi:MAG: hypothetical protein WAU86_23210, partial [Oricola sp.]
MFFVAPPACAANAQFVFDLPLELLLNVPFDPAPSGPEARSGRNEQEACMKHLMTALLAGAVLAGGIGYA